MSALPPLRLGVLGFSEDEVAELRAMVQTLGARWTMAETTPLHALLLARGTRVGDPDDHAVLRVRLDPRRLEALGEHRLEPLLLRRPIRRSTLQVALEAACTRLERFATRRRAAG
jgi:hypothetical protein